MRYTRSTVILLISSIGLAPIAGCESLPGNPKSQGTVIGGASGAAAGAIIAKNNRLLGALIGGALGAGGGYLIGANWDKINGNKKDEAVAAAKRAEEHPATASQVKDSDTADVNKDGFVTLDEVVAMKDAGLGDKEMIKRLERTQQYFELTTDQQKYLRDHGVDQKVVDAMINMHPDDTARTASNTQTGDVDMRTDRNR